MDSTLSQMFPIGTRYETLAGLAYATIMVLNLCCYAVYSTYTSDGDSFAADSYVPIKGWPLVINTERLIFHPTYPMT